MSRPPRSFFPRLAGIACLCLLPLLCHAMPTTTVTTQRDADGRWQLLRNGQPYAVNGVGGGRHLELAVSIGATTVRTWGILSLETPIDGKPMADRAHELGLTILAGIWLKHERHGFNYGDQAFLQQQRDEVRDAVRRYRDHPAILIWGLGNEMEHTVGPGDPLRIWREIEVLARIIREEDPHRPIMTILAGAALAKISAVREHCPTIDRKSVV